MQFDTHIHSRLSPDSEADPSDIIQALRGRGLGCCFTEHVDYVTFTDQSDKNATDAPVSPCDFLLSDPDDYPKCYSRLKAPDVAVGLEIGLNAAYLKLNERTAAKEGLDFVIGSIHFVDGYDMTSGPYYRAYDDPYRRLLEYTGEMALLCGFFDTLGHIDYISRYSPLHKKEVIYSDYPEEYDALFKILIGRDITIEINTVRFGTKEAEGAMFGVLQRYRELGGRHVTIGSDAHRVRDLARHHGGALRMAGEAGLKPVYYRERKLCLC